MLDCQNVFANQIAWENKKNCASISSVDCQYETTKGRIPPKKQRKSPQITPITKKQRRKNMKNIKKYMKIIIKNIKYNEKKPKITYTSYVTYIIYVLDTPYQK